jgi:hypothetical protein
MPETITCAQLASENGVTQLASNIDETDVSVGSKADLKPPMIDVRSSPGSGRSSGRWLRQLCATTGLMHRNNYSITSSARASNKG